MERKDFLKTTGTFCAMVCASLAVNSLAACSSLPVYKTTLNENRIMVPYSLFAKSDLQIIRTRLLQYDIALQKEKDGSFTALRMRCTHANSHLTSTGNGFTCNLHGSRFNSDGSVAKGPAEKSLLRFKTEILPENIVILIE